MQMEEIKYSSSESAPKSPNGNPPLTPNQHQPAHFDINPYSISGNSPRSLAPKPDISQFPSGTALMTPLALGQSNRVGTRPPLSHGELLYFSSKGKPEVGSQEWHKNRRESHKEVERKRRECINYNIGVLGDMVQGPEKNKGGILNRVVKYISQLRRENELLKTLTQESNAKGLNRLVQELNAQVDLLTEENNRLKSIIAPKQLEIGPRDQSITLTKPSFHSEAQIQPKYENQTKNQLKFQPYVQPVLQPNAQTNGRSNGN